MKFREAFDDLPTELEWEGAEGAIGAVLQHLSPGLDTILVGGLNHGTQVEVRLARSGARVEPGVVWIAPADHHLAVRMGGRLEVDREGDRVHGHRPSGTVLLNTIARTYGRSAAGLVLTGMGDDGGDGLRALDGPAVGAPA